jgi:hypothetical protein
MTTDDKALPFDHVRIGEETLTVEQFLALPTSERVRYVLHGGVEFLAGTNPVETAEALRALRDYAKAQQDP